MNTPNATAQRSIVAGAISGYYLEEVKLELTLRQLRWLAIASPIISVLLMEVVRAVTAGVPTPGGRFLLDGTVALALLIASSVLVRSIGRVQERLSRDNRELRALHGAGLDISAELSLDPVLNKVVERARTLVGARYGALSVVKEDGSIQSFLTSGVSGEERARIGAPPVGHGLLGVVLHEGERLRLKDSGRDPRSSGFPANHPESHSLRACAVTRKERSAGYPDVSGQRWRVRVH